MIDDRVLSTQPRRSASEPMALQPRVRRWAAVVITVLLLGVGWESVKLVFGISDQKLPHLAAIAAEFGTRTRGGAGPFWGVTMLQNAAITTGEAFAGFALGATLGCVLALAFAASRLLERGCMPYIIGSQTVPILAIAPMVVVGMGRMGAASWVAQAMVAAYLTFFPVTIGMLRGLRATAPDALALMHSYAASPVQVFVKLRWPAALPYLFTSLKVAAPASVIGAIVAELPAGSQRGIGVALLNAAQYYNSRPPVLYATVLVAAAVGLFCYGVVALAERLVLKQRPVPND